jgi:hypothetical protein
VPAWLTLLPPPPPLLLLLPLLLCGWVGWRAGHH